MSKLEVMLKYISEYNNFYKKNIKEYNITNPTDITQYQILTRQNLQEDRYNMFSDGYKQKYFSRLLKRQFSSGSSGVPINVYWDYSDYNRSIMALWRKRALYYNVMPNDKYIKFTLRTYNQKSSSGRVNYTFEDSNILSVNRSSLQDELSYRELISIIEQFSPSWLYIQPSVLQKLLYFYNKIDTIPPKTIKYIESVSVILPSSLKKQASSFWNAPVVNMYGSEEMNGIAYECPCNQMHILDDNIHFECLTNNHISPFGEGESIITNLHNKAMPLIRYNQGDVIRISKLTKTCPCGNKSPIIEIIKGRIHNCIYGDDFEINSFLLIEVVEDVNNHFGDLITEYRFVYFKSQKEIDCYVSITTDNKLWETRIISELEAVFRAKTLAKSNIAFKAYPFVPLQQKGTKFDILEVKE